MRLFDCFMLDDSNTLWYVVKKYEYDNRIASLKMPTLPAPMDAPASVSNGLPQVQNSLLEYAP